MSCAFIKENTNKKRYLLPNHVAYQKYQFFEVYKSLLPKTKPRIVPIVEIDAEAPLFGGVSYNCC